MKFRAGTAAVVMLVGSLVLTGCSSDVSDRVLAQLDERGVVCASSVAEGWSALESTAAPADNIDTLKQEGYLNVGIRASEVGPAVFTGASGDLSGYYVDTAYALADELGLKVRFTTVNSIDSALADSVDVVLSAHTGESAVASIVAPFDDEALAFFGKGTGEKITSQQLNSKTIGVQESSASQRALVASNLKVNIETYSNINEAFKALNKGDVDFVLCDANSGSYLTCFFPSISVGGTLGEVSQEGFAVLTANKDLQSALAAGYEKLGSNGRLALIRARWLGRSSRLSELWDTPEVAGLTSSQEEESSEDAESVASNPTSRVSSAGSNAADVS
ncbi:MAG: substrate-binding periplasmic protein [Atopobiaceae bacterium]|jgi:ABC-type amino acid transport substrate-binding protein